MAAEVTSQVRYHSLPFIDMKCIALTYSKAGATDYATCSAYGIKTIVFACAKIVGTGADDPCTWATNVLTLTTGTGAGAAIVWGTC